jgi:uncharacterized protein
MSREFPDLLNPWKAADGCRTFEGTMPLAWMKRLAPMLAPRTGNPDGGESAPHSGASVVAWADAQFRADFAHDGQGYVTVELWVEAELPLVCQRSLQPYLEPVKRHSLLAVVEDIAEQDLLPDHYEPVLVEQGHLALLDLVEDELLLGVPQVPRNPEATATDLSTDDADGSPAGTAAEPTQRPFEALASLLEKRAKDS